MKYLLTHERQDYDESLSTPIAIFDDPDMAKQWAALDHRTTNGNVQWCQYIGIDSWYAFTGERNCSWDITKIPENPVPGTRLDTAS